MVDEEDRRDSVQSLAGLLELLRGSGDPGPGWRCSRFAVQSVKLSEENFNKRRNVSCLLTHCCFC